MLVISLVCCRPYGAHFVLASFVVGMSNKWAVASALFVLAAVWFSKVPELLRERNRRKKMGEGFCVPRRFFLKKECFSCLVLMPCFCLP